MLVNRLEKQFPLLKLTNNIAENTPVYIMVLGAGYSEDTKFSAADRLSASSLVRLAEGIRIHRLITGSIIVLSGNVPVLSGNQADVMADAAISLGVNPSSIQKITLAKNTNDEALYALRSTLFFI